MSEVPLISTEKQAELLQGFCDQLTQRINGLGFDFKDVTEVLKAVWDTGNGL